MLEMICQNMSNQIDMLTMMQKHAHRAVHIRSPTTLLGTPAHLYIHTIKSANHVVAGQRINHSDTDQELQFMFTSNIKMGEKMRP